MAIAVKVECKFAKKKSRHLEDTYCNGDSAFVTENPKQEPCFGTGEAI